MGDFYWIPIDYTVLNNLYVINNTCNNIKNQVRLYQVTKGTPVLKVKKYFAFYHIAFWNKDFSQNLKE